MSRSRRTAPPDEFTLDHAIQCEVRFESVTIVERGSLQEPDRTVTEEHFQLIFSNWQDQWAEITFAANNRSLSRLERFSDALQQVLADFKSTHPPEPPEPEPKPVIEYDEDGFVKRPLLFAPSIVKTPDDDDDDEPAPTKPKPKRRNGRRLQ